MKLSIKSQYAVQALLELVRHQDAAPLSISVLCKDQNFSTTFTEQLFNRLRRSGILTSIRGKHGGYILAQPPEKISILAVIDAVGEPLKATYCQVNSDRGCQGGSTRCSMHHVWANLEIIMRRYLDSITLADVLANNIPNNGACSFASGQRIDA